MEWIWRLISDGTEGVRGRPDFFTCIFFLKFTLDLNTLFSYPTGGTVSRIEALVASKEKGKSYLKT